MTKEERIEFIKTTTTKKIIEAMESTDSNWIEEWTGGCTELPYNPTTKTPYSGTNIVWLMMQGRPSSKWAGYKQWQKVGRKVKLDENGRLGDNTPTDIIKVVPVPKKDKDGNKTDEIIPIIKVLRVFNESQLDDYEPEVKETANPNWVHAEIDKMVKSLNVKIQYGGTPSYNHQTDIITLPEQQDFKPTEGTAEQNYFATKLHELGHWTGHKNRLDRNLCQRDKVRYAKEELVAELTATLLSAYYGIEHTPLKSHAQYLNGWISMLKSDDQVMWEASQKAYEAMDFILKNSKQIKKVA